MTTLPTRSRPSRSVQVGQRSFGDMSWTSIIEPELKRSFAKQRWSNRLDALSAALLVALTLLVLSLGLMFAESALRNARSVLFGGNGFENAGLALAPSNTQSILRVHRESVDTSGPSSCPEGMVLASGSYCPKVEHKCVRWMETEGDFAWFRCAEYARPARCLAPRRTVRYCIDRNEYAPPGDSLPASNQSWTDAKRTCEQQGKRLCSESEWVFACEGEEMRPYPYGFARDANACNADREDIYRPDGSLRDLREDEEGHPECVSTFGVHHLSGNLEEWTTIDGSSPARPAMKGAYWQPSRNHCRAAQTAHDTHYEGVETGFRCCRDVKD